MLLSVLVKLAEMAGGDVVVDLAKALHGRLQPTDVERAVRAAAEASGVALDVKAAERWWAEAATRQAFLSGRPEVLAGALFDLLPPGTPAAGKEAAAEALLASLGQQDLSTDVLREIHSTLNAVLEPLLYGLDATLANTDEILARLEGVTASAASIPPYFQAPWPKARLAPRAAAFAEVDAVVARGATVALVGPAGTGKTQIAAHWVAAHRSEYEAVFWVDARLRLWDTLHAAVAGAGRSLVVIDGVVSADELDGVPMPPAATVVLTANDARVGQLCDVVDVGVFETDVAVAYLLAEAGPLATADDARSVADAVGCLPLGLAFAAAWCREQRRPLAAFLERLDTDPAVLKANPVLQYERTIASAWRLSLDAACAEAPEAEVLFFALAMTPGLPPRILQALPQPEARSDGDGVSLIGHGPADDALAALRRFSLVEDTGGLVALHSLVTRAVRLHVMETGTLVRHGWAVAVAVYGAGYLGSAGYMATAIPGLAEALRVVLAHPGALAQDPGTGGGLLRLVAEVTFVTRRFIHPWLASLGIHLRDLAKALDEQAYGELAAVLTIQGLAFAGVSRLDRLDDVHPFTDERMGGFAIPGAVERFMSLASRDGCARVGCLLGEMGWVAQQHGEQETLEQVQAAALRVMEGIPVAEWADQLLYFIATRRVESDEVKDEVAARSRLALGLGEGETLPADRSAFASALAALPESDEDPSDWLTLLVANSLRASVREGETDVAAALWARHQRALRHFVIPALVPFVMLDVAAMFAALGQAEEALEALEWSDGVVRLMPDVSGSLRTRAATYRGRVLTEAADRVRAAGGDADWIEALAEGEQR